MWNYFLNLRVQSTYWRAQALAWGIILVIVVAGAAFTTVLALYGIFGGGNIIYDAKGSPGPVEFRHYTHMWFKNGKYKSCKTCHDKLFAAQAHGTYVIRALMNSPTSKVHIGKEASTLYMTISGSAPDAPLVTYKVPRACRTCATGECHDGKESFSRFDCLGCHKQR
jgi:hypothetical protein